MFHLLDRVVDELNPELAAACLHPQRRLVLLRTSKRLRAAVTKLRLGLDLMVHNMRNNAPQSLLHYASIFRLQSIDLTHAQITPEMVDAFATVKDADWSHLHTLMLGRRFGKDGPELRLAPWLARCSKLAATDVLRRGFHDEHLWETLRGCHALDLTQFHMGKANAESIGRRLAGCSQLTKLKLRDNNPLCTVLMLEIALADNASVTDLNLERTRFDKPQLIRAMATWRPSRLSLVSLEIGHNNFCTTMFQFLGTELAYCTNLQRLDIEATNMNGISLQEFVRALTMRQERAVLPKLTDLYMGYAVGVTAETSVEDMRKLMRALPGVVKLDMRACDFDAKIVSAMHEEGWLSQIYELNLARNNLCWHAGHIMGQLVQDPIAMEVLDLSSNRWGNGEAHHVGMFLRKCVKLQSIRIGTDEEISEATAVILAESLCENSSLRSVVLPWGNLHVEAMQRLGQMVARNPRLETLDIHNSRISNHGVLAMLREIQSPCMLRDLNLCSNDLGDTGVGWLVQSPAAFPWLMRLGLASCRVSDTGAQMLAGVVRRWQALQVLDLIGNQITDEGAQHLLSGCRGVKLMLGGNLLSVDMCARLRVKL